MTAVHFLTPEDAVELTKALEAEGYRTALQANPDPAARASWLLEVTPFDDGVVALVDVYGGWLPDET